MHGYRVDFHFLGNFAYPVIVLDEQFDLFCKDEDTAFFSELDLALEFAIEKIGEIFSRYTAKDDTHDVFNILTALKTRYEEVLIEYYMYKLSGETLDGFEI